MKAIYEFEAELLEAGYDFEPANDGHNIDDLNEEDRTLLSGMLQVFFTTLPSWKLDCEELASRCGTVGQIAKEYLDTIYEQLVAVFTCDVQEFVVGCLDGYDDEEDVSNGHE